MTLSVVDHCSGHYIYIHIGKWTLNQSKIGIDATIYRYHIDT